jgi:hypothetical protein
MIPRAKLSIFEKLDEILHFAKPSLDTLEKSEAVFMKCTNTSVEDMVTIEEDR